MVAEHSVVSREMEDGIKWLGVATSMDRRSVSVNADTNTVTDAIRNDCVAAEHSNQPLNSL